MQRPVIAVVGVCAAGKSTLARGLQALGYAAFSVPQEHSVVRRLWQRRAPDLLLLLTVSYDQVVRRRPQLAIGPDLYHEQQRRLVLARQECHGVIDTDGLSVEQVLAAALATIQAWRPPPAEPAPPRFPGPRAGQG